MRECADAAHAHATYVDPQVSSGDLRGPMIKVSFLLTGFWQAFVPMSYSVPSSFLPTLSFNKSSYSETVTIQTKAASQAHFRLLNKPQTLFFVRVM